MMGEGRITRGHIMNSKKRNIKMKQLHKKLKVASKAGMATGSTTGRGMRWSKAKKGKKFTPKRGKNKYNSKKKKKTKKTWRHLTLKFSDLKPWASASASDAGASTSLSEWGKGKK